MCTVDVRNQRSVAAAGERRVPGGSRRCGRESNADADRMRRMRRHYRCTTVLVDETGRAPRRREPRGETSPLRPGCRGAMTVWARARGGQDPAVLVRGYTQCVGIHSVSKKPKVQGPSKGKVPAAYRRLCTTGLNPHSTVISVRTQLRYSTQLYCVTCMRSQISDRDQ